MKKRLFLIMLAVLVVLVSCEPIHVDSLTHSITYTLDGKDISLKDLIGKKIGVSILDTIRKDVEGNE